MAQPSKSNGTSICESFLVSFALFNFEGPPGSRAIRGIRRRILTNSSPLDRKVEQIFQEGGTGTFKKGGLTQAQT